ncbi:MAG: phage holin family protein [Clostridiales bacterium]|jgi:putative membrane protein|nr:phage holin family protein [Clostridiales bacterium]HQD42554.1 phage holin family protein [Bacillota bacterium]
MAERERNNEGRQAESGWNIGSIVIRLIVAAVVLGITAFLTPGFSIDGIWALIIGAIVLAVLDYLVAKLIGVEASPFGKGIVGFITAAVIIYATQYFVAGFNVTIWGAIIGALIFGIVDAIIPGQAM